MKHKLRTLHHNNDDGLESPKHTGKGIKISSQVQQLINKHKVTTLHSNNKHWSGKLVSKMHNYQNLETRSTNWGVDFTNNCVWSGKVSTTEIIKKPRLAASEAQTEQTPQMQQWWDIKEDPEQDLSSQDFKILHNSNDMEMGMWMWNYAILRLGAAKEFKHKLRSSAAHKQLTLVRKGEHSQNHQN